MMILTNKLKIAIDHRRLGQIPHNLTLINIAKLALLLSSIHTTLKHLNTSSLPKLILFLLCLLETRIQSGMEQRSNDADAAVRDAQIKPSEEEYASGTVHIEICKKNLLRLDLNRDDYCDSNTSKSAFL